MKTTLLICTTFLLSSMPSFATVCSSVMDGAWENPLTWSCGHVPLAGDTIVISVNDTVTISTNTDMTSAASVIIVEGYFLFDTPSAKLHMGCGSKIEIRPGGTIASSGVGTPSHQIKICNTEIWEGQDGELTGPLIIVGPEPLAVSLVEFNANYSSGTLSSNWTVSGEFNNASFSIAYSHDGTNWEEIASVNSIGNHTDTKMYELTSAIRITVATSYVRLQQHDLDGQTKVLSTIVIENNSEDDIKLFPNPSKLGQTLTLQIDANTKGDLIVEIYDLLGQRISLISSKASVGFNTVNIGDAIHKPGKYFVTTRLNDTTMKSQLVVF